MQNKKTSLGTNDTKTYFVMSDGIKREYYSLLHSIMKVFTPNEYLHKTFTKEQYSFIASYFNRWLIEIDNYNDIKGKYDTYADWLEDQSKYQILTDKMLKMFNVSNEKYEEFLQISIYKFDYVFMLRLMDLAKEYAAEYNKWLETFKTTDVYKAYIERIKIKK